MLVLLKLNYRVDFNKMLSRSRGTRCRSRLRHCATSRKVAGSIPYGAIENFH